MRHNNPNFDLEVQLLPTHAIFVCAGARAFTGLMCRHRFTGLGHVGLCAVVPYSLQCVCSDSAVS